MPEIIPIITAVVSAIGVGTEIYGLTQKPGGSAKASTTPTPQTSTTNAAQTSSVEQALPTLQSLTGGSLSPEYAAQYGAGQTGLGNNPQAAGNIQAAINQFFGLSAPGNTGLTPTSSSTGGNSIVDLLSRSKGTSSGGGGGGSNLIDGLLNSDTFKGLTGG